MTEGKFYMHPTSWEADTRDAFKKGMTGQSRSHGLLVAVGVLLTLIPHDAVGQEPSPATADASVWWVALRVGLTDLDVDHAAPGSISTVTLERQFGDRIGGVLEAGLGGVDEPGRCLEGSAAEFECLKTSWWPTLGLGTRIRFFKEAAAGTTWYGTAHLVRHGPSLLSAYDLGIGVSLTAVYGLQVGLEVRKRTAWDGPGTGLLYFFRVAGPVGGVPTRR